MPAFEGAQPTPVTGVALAAPVTGVARAERTLMVMHEQQSRPGNGASSFISCMVRAVQSLPATVEGLVSALGVDKAELPPQEYLDSTRSLSGRGCPRPLLESRSP